MAKKISRPTITTQVKTQLWTFSGGRCQFDGCNKPLWRNDLTMAKMNTSYIAHIYAYSINGPRYDARLSPLLEKDFTNLMLVCDVCHRAFDNMDKVDEYTAEYLIKMKRDHEERIELLTSLKLEKRSHVILYGAKIGEHVSPLHQKGAVQAMLPEFYPTSERPIELGIKNSALIDSSDHYWQSESENLAVLFKEEVKFIKEKHEVQHYSVFGLAPQPLLIKLGTLLSDIYPAEIYQLHREPATWKWQSEEVITEYTLDESIGKGKKVALKISLSATITNERIMQVLDEDVEVWSITIPNPGVDFLKSKRQLKDLKIKMREAFDRIKAKHGEDAELHIFPAMPVSAAIELGRVWMPKADLPFAIYDQNTKRNGFVKTLTIK